MKPISRLMHRVGFVLGLCVSLPLISTSALSAQTGTVTGTVVDQATSQPLSGAHVTIAGTNLGAFADGEGVFIITNVPAGTRQVRATRLGYSQLTQTVEVEADVESTVDLVMRSSAVPIEGIVVTHTGEMQRVRERGNVIGQISVGEMDLAPITNLSSVLQGRTAGVVVQQSAGTTGSGSRVRIRGSASASLGNQPLLVIDGVRINDSPQSFSIGTGGQAPSRLDDLNPAEIESIEVLKGPAAAALYGTAAATGVIQVTTRRGRPGPAQWNAYSEYGLLHDRTDWPGNYQMLGTTPGGDTVFCPTFAAAAGACEPTEVQSWNPLMDRPEGAGTSNSDLGPASPFRDGNRQTYGANVSWGSDRFTYYLSGEVAEERGIFQNNNLDRVALRANVQASLRDDLDLTLTSGWTSSDLQIPWGDNTIGPVGDALTGSPTDDPETRGYALHPPDVLARVDTRQDLGRLIGSLNANYRPLSWLNFVGTAGLDVVNRHDTETLPPATIFDADFPDGRRISNRVQINNYTATLGATATHELTPSIMSTSSLGTQYHREVFRATEATGWELLAGTASLAGTNARFEVGETNEDVVLLGAYVQQQLGWRDRLFATGALRGDDSSAFGADFGMSWYPSLSLSWIASEETWFPQVEAITSLRLRSAVGRSGLRPGFRDAITYYSPVSATVQARDTPSFTVGGAGDPDLRPEISTEIEGGFDLGLFDDRLGVELTFYDKTSRDALIARRLAPSLGTATTRFENIGEVSNRGVEALINATLLNSSTARWDATLTAGTNRNRLVEMEDADPIIFGLASGQQHTEGYPLGGYWQFPYEYEDADGDGLLTLDDVVMADEMEFAGSPFPTRNLSFESDITLFDLVRVSALLEHQGGHTLWAGSEEWQCVFLLCEALNDPEAPLERQARGIATWNYFSWWGYLEDASYTKLREVAITLMAPDRLAQRWGMDTLSLTLSGRNLATWTDFTGTDPEVNFAGQSNFSTAEFQSQPPIRHWMARVNVTF